MSVSDYNALLDNVFSKLPEKNSKGERFEPPVPECFLQGNKTVVRNFDAMCQKLRRKPEELAKFLFRELAVPGTIAGKTLVLQTKVPARMLNEKFSFYVDQCVMCRECGKPDTHIEYGAPVNTLICEACGATRPIRV